MKVGTERTRKVEHGGLPTDATQFHINPENTGHIMQILREMYSDNEQAVLREYTANAIDAHNQVGSTAPFEVSLPTDLDPVFKVRDFGPGLDVAQTKELLYGFGSSGEHKRASNTQIGGFGIGCKCAFAICDSFTYTVYHGGKERVWSCYLDDLDNGKADLMSEKDSNAPTGVLVSIPVSPDSIDRFHVLAQHAFMYYPIKPKVLRAKHAIKLERKDKPVATMTAKVGEDEVKLEFFARSALTSHKSQGSVEMGGIVYPLDWDACGLDSLYKDDNTLRSMHRRLMLNTVIRAPIGWVTLSPSRETLQYNRRTKGIFAALFKALTYETLADVFDLYKAGISLNEKITKSSMLSSLTGDSVSLVKTALAKEPHKFWEVPMTSTRMTMPCEVKAGPTVHVVTVKSDRWTGGRYATDYGLNTQSEGEGLGCKELVEVCSADGDVNKQIIIGFVKKGLQYVTSTMAKHLYLLANAPKGIVDYRAGLRNEPSTYSSQHRLSTLGRRSHVMFLKVQDKAHMKQVMKQMNLVSGNGVVVFDTLIEDKLDDKRSEQIADFTYKAPSYRSTNGPTEYAQHKEKCFKLSSAGYNSVKSQKWDKLDFDWKARGDKPTPVLSIHKFEIALQGLKPELVPQAEPSTTDDKGITRCFGAEFNELWQTLAGTERIPALRHSDAKKLFKRKNCPAVSFGEWWYSTVVKPMMDHDPRFVWWLSIPRKGITTYRRGPHGSPPPWHLGVLAEVSRFIENEGGLKADVPDSVRVAVDDWRALTFCESWVVTNLLGGDHSLFHAFATVFYEMYDPAACQGDLKVGDDSLTSFYSKVYRAHEVALVSYVPEAWPFYVSAPVSWRTGITGSDNRYTYSGLKPYIEAKKEKCIFGIDPDLLTDSKVYHADVITQKQENVVDQIILQLIYPALVDRLLDRDEGTAVTIPATPGDAWAITKPKAKEEKDDE